MSESSSPSLSDFSTRSQKLYNFALKYKHSNPTKSHQLLKKLLKFQPELEQHELIKQFHEDMTQESGKQKQQEQIQLNHAKEENKATKGSIKSNFEQMPSVSVDLTTPNLSTAKKRNWDSPHYAKKHLKDFGYAYDEQGFLRNVETGLPFKWEGQDHYDALGDAIKRHLATVLTDNYKLKQVNLAADSENGMNDQGEQEKQQYPPVNVYMTPKAMETEGTLMVLIQGMGAVRPPMWALSLCINTKFDSDGKPLGGLRAGTMMEYMEKAAELGFEYLILNPNENYTHDSKCRPIPGNANPIEHVLTAYDKLISQSKAKRIVIVAHSYGGTAVVEGLLSQRESILPRLKSVVFTDSNHQQIHVEGLSDRAKSFLQQYAQNYVTSNQPCGKPLGGRAGVNIVSAGTQEHIWTSHKAWAHAFEYMLLCLQMSGTPEERLQVASQLKQEGNEQFVKKEFRAALAKYARCLLILSQTQSLSKEKTLQLRLTCHSNMSVCALQLKDYASAIRHASNGIELRDEDAVKDSKLVALFVKTYARRAQAHLSQSEFDAAGKDIESGLELDAENAVLKSLKKRRSTAIEKRKKAEKKAYAGMFKM